MSLIASASPHHAYFTGTYTGCLGDYLHLDWYLPVPRICDQPNRNGIRVGHLRYLPAE
jgi:hypothetical protein